MKKYCLAFIGLICMFFSASTVYAEKVLILSAVEDSIVDNFIFEKILTEGYQRIGIKVKKKITQWKGR